MTNYQKGSIEKIKDIAALNCVVSVGRYGLYSNQMMKSVFEHFIRLCDGRIDHLFKDTYDKLDRKKIKGLVKDLEEKHKQVNHF